MRTIGTLLIAFLGIVPLSRFAQEPSWIKTAKDKDKRTALQDRTQQVRGDSGKWSEEARLQLAPPIQQKPAKMPLDDWADQLLKKKNLQLTGQDDVWLLFRTEQLDDNDRLWIERIERRGNQLTIVANRAQWQGKYFRNFTYFQVIGINLGKLEPGQYEAKCVLKPLLFAKFDGDGRPQDNWPQDERAADKKPGELRLAFSVGKNAR